MFSGWNLWVWLSGRWVWLECIGVVSGCCCCKEIYRFPHTIPLALAPFCSSILTSLFIFKMIFVLVYVIFVQYSKCCSKNTRDHSKLRSRRHVHYNYIDKHVDYDSQDFHVCSTNNGIVEVNLLHV